MPRTFGLKPPEPIFRPRTGALIEALVRSAGAVASLILLALSLRLAFGSGAGPAFVQRLQDWLFGSFPGLTAAASAGLALAMFLEITRAYRKRFGFPWFASLCFSGCAFACLMALHSVLR